MPRRRTILTAAFYALLAALFAMPFVRGHRCADAGGRFERTTLTCVLSDPAELDRGGTGPLPHPTSHSVS